MANGGHSDSVEGNCKLLVDVGHKGDVIALFGSFPARFLKATAAALAPAHRFIKFVLRLSQHDYSPQFRQCRDAAIVWNIDYCVCATMHLDSFRLFSTGHFEEVSIEPNLQNDFRMMFVVNSAGHLAVSNDVFIFVQYQKVRVTDDLAFDAVDEGHHSKGGLVDDSGPRRNRLLRLAETLFPRHSAQAHERSKCAQVL